MVGEGPPFSLHDRRMMPCPHPPDQGDHAACPTVPALSITPVNALRLHHLTWQPAGGGRPVLDAVDFAVGTGEVVAVLGPSGAGKTSLLRLVAGLEVPTRGRIEIAGADVTALTANDRPVGLVAQNARLFPNLTVMDNVAFRLRLASADAQGAQSALARARSTLQLLDIEALAQRLPGELSEGEHQRVALARALAPGPTMLLLDEPMSHLDRRLRRALRRQILDLGAGLGLTLVYVTHDQAEAMAVSDRIVLLHEGRVVQQGTPRSLYEQPASAFVAAFMGDMRLFDAWSDSCGVVKLGPLHLCKPIDPLPGAAPVPGPVRVVVRPHAWRIGPAHARGLPARVLRSACLGAQVEYTLASDLGEVLALTPRAPLLHENGAPVSLTLAGQGVSILPAA
jgi:iron(III) transport system ATP-binding protein